MNSFEIGVAFLAYRGHPEWRHAFHRFAESYERLPSGIAHRLYIIFKGFEDPEHLHEGAQCFARLSYTPIPVADQGFGLRAYKLASRSMREEIICFLNTKSEILATDWLLKLALQLRNPGVGLVGNTGSFESLTRFGLVDFPDFPNVHVRTNAFLVRARHFNAIARFRSLDTKLDGWKFESGWNSLSREILRRGLKILVVGQDGKGYEPHQWPASGTFRSPGNTNALIADDDYRQFPQLDAHANATLVRATWGGYLQSPPTSDEELFVHSPLSCRDTRGAGPFRVLSRAVLPRILKRGRTLLGLA